MTSRPRKQRASRGRERNPRAEHHSHATALKTLPEYDCVGDPGRESSFFAAGLEYMVKVGDPMNLIDYFRRQFAYNEWANREVLAALRASREASTRPVQLVA